MFLMWKSMLSCVASYLGLSYETLNSVPFGMKIPRTILSDCAYVIQVISLFLM